MPLTKVKQLNVKENFAFKVVCVRVCAFSLILWFEGSFSKSWQDDIVSDNKLKLISNLLRKRDCLTAR